jgi:Phage integrase, N-terminal SAM-like domain
VTEFMTWCESAGVNSIESVQPLHVATWIEAQSRRADISAPTVKQQLAAIRHLFDWLVTGQIVPVNPAAWCAGPGMRDRPVRTIDRDRASAIMPPEQTVDLFAVSGVNAGVVICSLAGPERRPALVRCDKRPRTRSPMAFRMRSVSKCRRRCSSRS